MSPIALILFPRESTLTWTVDIEVCVGVCVCSREYSPLHWSATSFTISLVFMTYLCVFEGVSWVCPVCVCVCSCACTRLCSCSGMSRPVPYLGRLIGFGGRTQSYCIVSKPQKYDRQTDAPADRQAQDVTKLLQCSSWHGLKDSCV